MSKNLRRKTLALGVILLFIAGLFVPCSQSLRTQTQKNPLVISEQTDKSTENGKITYYSFGKNGLEKQETILSRSNTLKIYEKYQELKKETTSNPYSQKTQRVTQEFFDLLVENQALPTGMSKDQLLPVLQPPVITPKHLFTGISPFQNKASEWFCNFATFGTGSAFPIIILPRFIPFLLSPIPRAFVWWSTPEGITSVGGLISRTGFLAGGQQKGIALGFWGIGFSIFLPPIMSYGIFGYAVFARVTAEEFVFYPPNNPPEITQTDPVNGEQMVPISTTELRFEINDADNDFMSYNVTTEPDVGSGSGGLKPSGTYSIPVSGLEDLTKYTWYVEVTDGKDTMEKTMTFTTEAVAPILSNPLPADGERDVPMDLPQLQFTLKDYQGDVMEYTVQTSPNIGSVHVTGVHDGTYTVPISGMTYGATYRWYVNITDGAHWTRKIFSFETGYPSQFNPFEFGWQYRKQITIDHTQVLDDLTHFPLLISTADADLHQKAQTDGGDIMFMNDIGVSTRLYHDLELYTSSSGSLIAWVDIPSLSSSTDTVFYMYYGNPTCINQQYPEKTWDSHYKAVWHLNNNPTGTILDSTTNNNDGTSHGSMTSSNLIDGKTGKCLEFDGINDYISVPDSPSLKPTDVTLVAWFCPQQENLPEGNFLAKHCYDYWGNAAGHTYALCLRPDDLIAGGIETDTYEQASYFGFHPFTLNTWHYFTLTFDETTNTGSFYVNGVLQETKTVDDSALWYDDPWDFTMGGCRWSGGSSQVINTFYKCGLDEIKILNIPLGPGWISTEFNNQNNPSSFLSIGPEESGP